MNILKNKWALLCIALLVFVSCNYNDINENENNPADVPISSILSASETFAMYELGDIPGRMSNIVTQQFAGGGNQSALQDRYSITENDPNQNWVNLYQGGLEQYKVIITRATEENSPHYSGIAKILSAFTLGVLTDLWGDIPWTEALQGADNLQPAFDTQEFIYSEIQRLLDEGIAEVGAAVSNATPGSDDLIYGGDMDKWKAAAYSIKARHYNNLSKVDPTGSANDALSAIGNAISSNNENMEMIFVSDITGQNPLYAFFNVQRVGDALMGKFFVDLLVGLSDPRLPMFVENIGTPSVPEYVGSAAGLAENGSSIGTFYSVPDAPLFGITFAEIKFIEAEASMRLGMTAQAQAAYSAAIQASMEQYGVASADIATYLASNGTLTLGSEMNQIMTQKYIAMFTSHQAWTDWRRTGVPSLTPAANNVTGNVIPRRFPYPQSERQNNSANVNAASNNNPGNVTARVWWDK